MGVRYTTTVVLLVVVGVVLVGASPLALGLFSGAASQWQRLSFIGQTYGAVSALIALFALVGVVLTLVFQARETRRAVEETRRQAMSELLRMAMEDPDLDECWGPITGPEDPKTRKQRLYINMIISQWSTAFETRALPERRLRAIADEMFRGAPGRAYWAEAREPWLATTGNRAERRFAEILDDQYHRAAPETPETPESESEDDVSGRGPHGRRRAWLPAAAGFVAGACTGAAAALLTRHRAELPRIHKRG